MTKIMELREIDGALARRRNNMFQRRHYKYLADTIINAPGLAMKNKIALFFFVEQSFVRDHANFNVPWWREQWDNQYSAHFPASSVFLADTRTSE